MILITTALHWLDLAHEVGETADLCPGDAGDVKLAKRGAVRLPDQRKRVTSFEEPRRHLRIGGRSDRNPVVQATEERLPPGV